MYDNLSFPEATTIQNQMVGKLKFQELQTIKTVAGADISFNKNSTTMYAGITIFSFPDMVLQSYALATFETSFPYKAGYLGFKEVPALLKVWELINNKPDILVLDGNGILHPRRMGVASHFGILANHPTIGCAKSMLYGENYEPKNEKFNSTEIKAKNELLGYALKTKLNCAPVYVSAGHLITQCQSLDIIKQCVRNYRIPEPTRMAHEIVNKFRNGKLAAGFHYEIPPLTLF